jgi:predicted dehydrogenase
VADRPLGVGVVGYGLAGRSFHAPFIAAVDGLELVAIATADPARAAQAGAEHPAAAVVPWADALLDRPDVEIVVVAAPNRSHVPVGIQALESGRHVVVDKPIATSVADAERLIDTAARTGHHCSVYQNRRWDGDFLTVRRLVDDGTLGELDSVEARFERWATVDPIWREDAAQRGGPLPDLGAHLLDQALLLLGPARRVWTQAARRRAGSQVDDSVFVALDHGRGGWSRSWVSLIASRVGPRLRVRGLGGEYVKDDLDPQEAHLLQGRRPRTPGFGVEAPEHAGRLHLPDGTGRVVPSVVGDYAYFYEGFRDAVRGIGPVPVDPRDSLAVLRVIDAAERSAATGTAVTLDG